MGVTFFSRMTLTSFPGAFFLVSAAITVPVLLIFAWFYWQVRKEQNEELKSSLSTASSTAVLGGVGDDGGEDGRGGMDDLELEDGGDSESDSESSTESVSSSRPQDVERY